MGDDRWDAVAGDFVRHYTQLYGQVRTHVLHAHLISHLPAAPAEIVDVGGGAGHQSIPLARAGYRVTIVDPSTVMLAEARKALDAEPRTVAARVDLVEADGERGVQLLGEARFDGVLCHGVLMYLDDPVPLVTALGALARPGGLVSSPRAGLGIVPPSTRSSPSSSKPAGAIRTGSSAASSTSSGPSARRRAEGEAPTRWCRALGLGQRVLTIGTREDDGVAVAVTDPELAVRGTARFTFRRVAMHRHDDLRVQLLRANDCGIEVVDLEPEEHAVADELRRVADLAVVVLDAPMVQLHDQLVTVVEPLVLRPAVIAPAPEQLLVPAARSFDVSDRDQRLGSQATKANEFAYSTVSATAGELRAADRAGQNPTMFTTAITTGIARTRARVG